MEKTKLSENEKKIIEEVKAQVADRLNDKELDGKFIFNLGYILGLIDRLTE